MMQFTVLFVKVVYMATNTKLLDELSELNKSIISIFNRGDITEDQAMELHSAFASINTVIKDVKRNQTDKFIKVKDNNE